jgi:hypothetical protein
MENLLGVERQANSSRSLKHEWQIKVIKSKTMCVNSTDRAYPESRADFLCINVKG